MNCRRLLAATLCCLLAPVGANAQGLLSPSGASIGQPRQIQPIAAEPTPPPESPVQQAARPSAILIRNPNTLQGEPPFALADQYGKVQRLVEPSRGLDLSQHVGEIVTIEHDTGRTLLASQLRFGAPRPLPNQPPQPTSFQHAQIAAPLAASPARQPVIITQFEADEPAADKAPLNAADLPAPITPAPAPVTLTPEPIVLEEIIGDPVLQPVQGLPLPAGAAAVTQPTGPVISPIDTIAGANRQQSNCLTPNCGCSDTAAPDLFFEAELLLLRLFNSEPSVQSDDYETGSRFTLGASTRDGSVWLARYLEYENENFDADGSDLSLELYNLEYGRTFNLGCRWTGLFTLGGQLTEFQDTTVPTPVDYGDAIGPVVGAQLRGPRFGGFHPLLGARYALQFGEAATAAGDSFGSFTTTELAAGIEYQQRTRGGTVFGRASIESVLIDGASSSGNFTPFGFGLSLGIAR